MSELKNPFAIRDDKTILIGDLQESERGLKCGCKCPNCSGDFIARMGDVRVPHFAHSKDACDEVQAYISGLYMKTQEILQELQDGDSFNLPPLIISYSFPNDRALCMENIADFVKIIKETDTAQNRKIIREEYSIVFEKAELCRDGKNNIQALELTYKCKAMAIKIKPPDSVCKSVPVSRHNDMATLVLDFAKDADKIQAYNSENFCKYLLSDKLDKYWIYNPKIKNAYPQIIEESRKAYKEQLELKKRIEETRKIEESRKAYQEQLERKRRHEETQSNVPRVLITQPIRAQIKTEIPAIRRDQIKTEIPIRAALFTCTECEQMKPEADFTYFQPNINSGICRECLKKKWS